MIIVQRELKTVRGSQIFHMYDLFFKMLKHFLLLLLLFFSLARRLAEVHIVHNKVCKSFYLVKKTERFIIFISRI